jgi:transcriptional regulator with XRE-family HTH domain
VGSAFIRESVLDKQLSSDFADGRVPYAEDKSWGSDNQMSDDSQSRVILDANFAARLNLASDQHPHTPEMNRGRLTWVRREMASRFDVSVSIETVRKWFSGEARPRPDKMKRLAELLEVDEAWLSLGVHPEMDRRERKARNALADGAVNVVAGLIQMAGGHPAFPEPDDTRAEKEHVDIFAVIKGGRYDIHVATATAGDGAYRFAVPTTYERLFVVGLIQTGPFCFDLVELSSDLVDKAGIRRGSHLEVIVEPKGRDYAASGETVRRIEGFDRRI